MDGGKENMYSGIPQSRMPVPTQGKSLTEITAAANNNAGSTSIVKPGTISSNHVKSSLREPAPKRKTLTERAGETKRDDPGAVPNPMGRANTTGKPTLRNQPSRYAVKPSHTLNVGATGRPQSTQSFTRPHTSQSRLQKPSKTPRPQTSMDTREDDASGHVLGKRKGMPQSSLSSSSCPQIPTSYPISQRGTYDNQMNYTSNWSSYQAGQHNVSLCTAFGALDVKDPPTELPQPQDPQKSKIPIPSTPVKHKSSLPPSPSKPARQSPQKHPPHIPQFLTRFSETKAWDTESRLGDNEELFHMLTEKIDDYNKNSVAHAETIALHKSRINELETLRNQNSEENSSLRADLETFKSRVSTAENALREITRNHEIEIDDLHRKHRHDCELIQQQCNRQIEATRSEHLDELRDVRRRLESELDDERTLRLRETNQMTTQVAIDKQRDQVELENKDREIERLNGHFQELKEELDRERKLNNDLRQNLSDAHSNSIGQESSIRALRARVEFLESGNQEQSEAFERLDRQLSEALAQTNETKEKLRREETLRRKLHNQVQELKGNIRVFCRVRPALGTGAEADVAKIQFPDSSADSKEIVVLGPEERSSLGNVTTKTNSFSFDHVFGPSSQNTDVFDEISQLIQSALDGYNVCIFCYGQTGSGKTHTMSSQDGMITRAVHQIYETAQGLEEKGWVYTMEGSFVEVYNENLNDLLGKTDDLDKKKHEIRHDMQKCKTTITDMTTVTLDSPETVESMLQRASSNRSVAATKANERSSRSHSVFILKLLGENSITGERSEGTLNLVDLAGSERLSHSGSTGERLKETQNINRSLSCLGDVIGALGQGKEGAHIPYRNSKLTYLLQFSLGGNSKTLMFVMVSPLQAHLSETLTSLKFATKVHNTHIGTAKRQSKTRES
ncbi:kinesin-like nuclear fusion protein [Arachnomyces sp. PD_36]|nr:kinesin-like nuclear fusion protein [Arachnomyces sp. PD_36]